jgi:hypothetical protein
LPICGEKADHRSLFAAGIPYRFMSIIDLSTFQKCSDDWSLMDG